MVDVGPTFLELAGGDVPESMDGTSFANVLKSKDMKYEWTKTEALIEYHSITGTRNTS